MIAEILNSDSSEASDLHLKAAICSPLTLRPTSCTPWLTCDGENMQKITFINTSQSKRGNAVDIPMTNSHIAAKSHASRRLKAWRGRGSNIKKHSEIELGLTQNDRVRFLHRVSVPTHETEAPEIFSNLLEVVELQTPSLGSNYRAATDEPRFFSTEATRLILIDSSHLLVRSNSEHPADYQLSTSLDPFIRVPVEISSRERSLLHFQLDEGRRLTLGTSANPTYCPAVYLAAITMQECPIYIYSTIAQAELLVQRMTGNLPTKTFHLRQSQAYKAMQSLLKDESASFEHKIAGFSQLFLLAIYLGRQDLQELHLLAMYEWIMRQGGFSYWMPKQLNFEQTKCLAFYAAHFSEVNLPVKDLQELNSILFRFISSLRAINNWARSTENDFRQCEGVVHHSSPSADQWCETQVAELQTYLDWLLEAGIGLSDDGCRHSGGGFYLLFNLCITQTQYRHSYADALHFIQHTASIMSGSADFIMLEDGRKLWKPVPTSMAIIMGYVRATMPRRVKERSSDDDEEISIAESSIDARLILPYLSDAMKLKLAQMFLACACTNIVNPSLSTNGDILDDGYVDLIAKHVIGVWKLNQEVNRGFDGHGKTAYYLPRVTKKTICLGSLDD